MKHRRLKVLTLTGFLVLLSVIGLSTLPKHSVSAASTTFSISAGPDAIASGDGCSLSEAIANINASNTTHSDCPAGVSTSGDINVISLPADTITLTTDLPIITKPTNIIGQGKGVSVVDGGGAAYSMFGIDVTDNVEGRSSSYRDFTVQNTRYDAPLDKCLSVSVDSPNSSILLENVDAIDCGQRSILLGTSTETFGDESENDQTATVSVTGSNVSRGVFMDYSTPDLAYAGITLTRSANMIVKNSTAQGNMLGFMAHTSREGVLNTLTVSNSTLNGNIVGLFLANSSDFDDITYNSTVNLVNNSIYSNSSSAEGYESSGSGIVIGGVPSDSPASAATTVSLQNNIIAANGLSGSLSNCVQADGVDLTITSLGNNLSDNGCLSSFGSSDILSENIDSTISALADNGGAVKTLALKAGSPAIDTAATIDSITTDARGFSRPFGVAYDIGAYEYGATDSNPPPTDPPKPPKTGRLAVAILITTSILAVVLLIARAYQKRYHKVLGSDR